MENKVAALAASSDPSLNASTSQTPAASLGTIESRIATGGVDQADLRLVIEERSGSYVYKTLDRRTGEVVSQYPREDILRLREEATYAAGDVIRTQV